VSDRIEVKTPTLIKPEVKITKKDLAQAVFYGLTELDRIKQELGV
jgi:hypothetical protein